MKISQAYVIINFYSNESTLQPIHKNYREPRCSNVHCTDIAGSICRL